MADKSDLGQDCKGGYARAEGQGPVGAPVDVDQAYEFAGETIEFFQNSLGVDLTALLGVDTGEGGKRLRSTVRFCPGNNAVLAGERQSVRATRSGTAAGCSTARAGPRPTTSSPTRSPTA